jgi:hypothetical protein
MAILETILIVLIVYYLLKILAKRFGPVLLRYAAKKTEKRFRDAFEKQARAQGRPTQSTEGEVTVDNTVRSKERFRSKKKVGEYIDFEEVE